MSFDYVRKSLKNLFLHDKKPSKEPLKQEAVPSQITLESNMSSYSYNKFTAIQKKKERLNPSKFALERLIDFYQKSSKIKDHDKLPVIVYREQKSEKKVKTKMIHPRWNQEESSSECMFDSIHQKSQLAHNQVESSSYFNQPSTSRQDIQPYYVQQAKQPVTYKPNLQAHLKLIDNDKSRFTNVTIQPRSKIHFSREEQQKQQNERIESPQKIENPQTPQMQKLTKVIEAKQENPIVVPLIQSKIVDQTPKQSVNRFQEIKKIEIQPFFSNQSAQKQEKISTAKEDVQKVQKQQPVEKEPQIIKPQRPGPDEAKQEIPTTTNQNIQIPAQEITTQIIQTQPEIVVNEQPIQQNNIQPFIDNNPFMAQQSGLAFAPPWDIKNVQPQVNSPQFNLFQQPINNQVQQPIAQLPFQNQNMSQNLFQNQNLFPQQQQQENMNLFQTFPQVQPMQMSNPLFESNNLFQQQQPSPFANNLLPVNQSPLFPFQQPVQQPQQQQAPIVFQTNSLGGGSFSAADQNQTKQTMNLFAAPPVGNQQQSSIFSTNFNEKPQEQTSRQPSINNRYISKVRDTQGPRMT